MMMTGIGTPRSQSRIAGMDLFLPEKVVVTKIQFGNVSTKFKESQNAWRFCHAAVIGMGT
jgi:hypothetical protein